MNSSTTIVVKAESELVGRVDHGRVRATTDEEIARHVAEDPDLAPTCNDRSNWVTVRRPPVPDVRAIRTAMGLSQAAFADRFRLGLRTLQQWEQGRAVPDRTARLFLMTIAAAPDVVAAAVADA